MKNLSIDELLEVEAEKKRRKIKEHRAAIIRERKCVSRHNAAIKLTETLWEKAETHLQKIITESKPLFDHLDACGLNSENGIIFGNFWTYGRLAAPFKSFVFKLAVFENNLLLTLEKKWDRNSTLKLDYYYKGNDHNNSSELDDIVRYNASLILKQLTRPVTAIPLLYEAEMDK